VGDELKTCAHRQKVSWAFNRQPEFFKQLQLFQLPTFRWFDSRSYVPWQDSIMDGQPMTKAD
jgi:hypothetical protein